MSKQDAKPKLPIAHVVEIPPQCPACGSRERTRFENQSTPTRYDNVGVNGKTVAADIVWAYVTCRDCEQRYRVRIITPVAD